VSASPRFAEVKCLKDSFELELGHSVRFCPPSSSEERIRVQFLSHLPSWASRQEGVNVFVQVHTHVDL